MFDLEKQGDFIENREKPTKKLQPIYEFIELCISQFHRLPPPTADPEIFFSRQNKSAKPQC